MKQRLATWLKRQVGLHWEHPAVNRLIRIAYTLVHSYENNNFDPRINGEFALVKALPQPTVIFDVGANVGEWTLAAARFHPQARIHAFEIVPATFQKLRQQTVDLPNVKTNECGLLDLPGQVQVSCFADSVLATVHQYPNQQATLISAPVTTGDAYCAQNGISHIDFLKLDVEGAEMQVLKGFSTLLESGRIRCIQFEYALINEIISLSLYQFYQLLEPLGYQIGKLHPNGLQILSFEDMVSGFRFGNFLAVQTKVDPLSPRFFHFSPNF